MILYINYIKFLIFLNFLKMWKIDYFSLLCLNFDYVILVLYVVFDNVLFGVW